MTGCKDRINRHLSSARRWLSQAERAFEGERDVRGELNLFLAQAELQHAREVNRSKHWRFKYPLLSHGLALGLAATVIAFGFGASFRLVQELPKPSEPAPVVVVDQSQPADTALKPLVVITPEPAAPVSNQPARQILTKPVQNETVEPVSAPAVPEKAISASQAAEEQEVRLSSEEMQKLVRSAGKSLRGL
ncbi:MAG TPA: hypothetical protein PKA28_13795 [Methylomusa anaerophila]|nr:hypothetical protein [Methylomusa anaerophila]HML89510.1 hypothetical protein [Methylomusa anaerophila]